MSDYAAAMAGRVAAHDAREAEKATDARSAREKALAGALEAMRGLAGRMQMSHQMAAAQRLHARRVAGERVLTEEADRLMREAEAADAAESGHENLPR